MVCHRISIADTVTPSHTVADCLHVNDNDYASFHVHNGIGDDNHVRVGCVGVTQLDVYPVPAGISNDVAVFWIVTVELADTVAASWPCRTKRVTV